MSYVDGPDLGRLLLELGRRGRGLEVAAVMVIATGVIDALRYLHREAGDVLGGPAAGRPVLHGAVTPQNVLIGTDGDVRLTDLGRAWPAGRAQPKAPTTRLRMGSLSPESVRDQPVSERTDVFHLGTLLYECLTGRHPFLTDTVQGTAREVGLTIPPTVCTLRPSVPVQLSVIVQRCLDADPTARWRSVGEVGRALAAVELPGHDDGPRALARELISVFPDHNDASRPWALRGGGFHPPFLPNVLAWLPAPPVELTEGPVRRRQSDGALVAPWAEHVSGSVRIPPFDPSGLRAASTPAALVPVGASAAPAPIQDPVAPPISGATVPAPPVASAPMAPAGSPVVPGIVVGALLGAVATALLFALFVPRTPSLPPSPTAPAPAVLTDGPQVELRTVQRPRDGVLLPLEGEQRPSSIGVSVPLLVVTEPGGATVFVDGERIGVSPVSVRRPPGALVQVQARHDGYRTNARLFSVPDEGGELVLTLERQPRPR